MGAIDRRVTIQDCATPALLRTKWRELQQEDMYQRGHGSYQGSLGEVHDLSVHATRFATEKEAHAFADKQFVEKREAVAFGYGQVASAFPVTKKDKDLADALQALETSLANFELDILRRFLAGKSKSKTCSGCGSAISKKSRERLTSPRYFEPARMGTHQHRDQCAELVGCPACHAPLLMTDTDTKRKKAMQTKHAQLRDKVQAAKLAHHAKHPPPGYVVAAVVPH